MPARIRPIAVMFCKHPRCRRSPTHEVREHDWSFVGNYCEQHGNEKVAIMDQYEALSLKARESSENKTPAKQAGTADLTPL